MWHRLGEAPEAQPPQPPPPPVAATRGCDAVPLGFVYAVAPAGGAAISIALVAASMASGPDSSPGAASFLRASAAAVAGALLAVVALLAVAAAHALFFLTPGMVDPSTDPAKWFLPLAEWGYAQPPHHTAIKVALHTAAWAGYITGALTLAAKADGAITAPWPTAFIPWLVVLASICPTLLMVHFREWQMRGSDDRVAMIAYCYVTAALLWAAVVAAAGWEVGAAAFGGQQALVAIVAAPLLPLCVLSVPLAGGAMSGEATRSGPGRVVARLGDFMLLAGFTLASLLLTLALLIAAIATAGSGTGTAAVLLCVAALVGVVAVGGCGVYRARVTLRL